MKKALLLSSLIFLSFPTFSNAADTYAGLFLGTASNFKVGDQPIGIPLEGGIKAGDWFSKYVGIEASFLMMNLPNGPGSPGTNSFSTTSSGSITSSGGGTTVKGGGPSSCPGWWEINICGNKSSTTTTKSPTTTSSNSTTTKFNSTSGTNGSDGGLFTIGSVDLMARIPIKNFSLYGGVGPAVISTSIGSSIAISAKIGSEIRKGSVGIFLEDQIVSLGTTQLYGLQGEPLFNFVQMGVNYHF